MHLPGRIRHNSTLSGKKKKEFGDKKIVTLEVTSSIWLTQTAEVSYLLWMNFRMHFYELHMLKITD